MPPPRPRARIQRDSRAGEHVDIPQDGSRGYLEMLRQLPSGHGPALDQQVDDFKQAVDLHSVHLYTDHTIKSDKCMSYYTVIPAHIEKEAGLSASFFRFAIRSMDVYSTMYAPVKSTVPRTERSQPSSLGEASMKSE